VLALEALLDGRPSGAYNLGTGTGHTNREVLDRIGATVGIPVPFQETDRRPGDPAALVADASRFRRDFGWQPQHSDLETIIGTAWDWLSRWKGL
jgi:UDP-glucose 4-epimerase